MSLDTMFTFLLLLLVVVVAIAVGGAAYLMVTNRRTWRETGREVGTADVPVGTPTGVEPDEDEGGHTGRVEPRDHEPRREFYKSMGLETTEDMKIRMYSVQDYRDELGGTRAGTDGGFVAALKAYRKLDDEWVEYSPRKAADVLELAPEDYEVDEEHSALLLTAVFVKVDPASESGYRGGSPPLSNRPMWTENPLPKLRGSILTHTAVRRLPPGLPTAARDVL